MNDKLEQLYNLYKQNGIIQSTDFNKFASADENQRRKLYDLGRQKGLFKTTDFNTFNTAFEPVKKKETTESPSVQKQESTSSVTPPKGPQKPSVSSVSKKPKIEEGYTLDSPNIKVYSGLPGRENIQYRYKADENKWQKRGDSGWNDVESKYYDYLTGYFKVKTKKDITKELESNVKKAEAEKELSDKELASVLGWSEQEVKKAKAGSGTPDKDFKAAMAKPDIVDPSKSKAISTMAISAQKASSDLGPNANSEQIKERAKYYETIETQKYLKSIGYDVDVNGNESDEKTKNALNKQRIKQDVITKDAFKAADAYQSIDNDINQNLLSNNEEFVVTELRKKYSKDGFSFEETGAGNAMIVKYSPLAGVETRQIEIPLNTSDINNVNTLKEFMKQSYMTASERKELNETDFEGAIKLMADNPYKYGTSLLSDDDFENHMSKTYDNLKQESKSLQEEYKNLQSRIDNFSKDPSDSKERAYINNKIYELSQKELQINNRYNDLSAIDKNINKIASINYDKAENIGNWVGVIGSQFIQGIANVEKAVLQTSMDVLPYAIGENIVDPFTRQQLKDKGYTDTQILDYASKDLKNNLYKDIKEGITNVSSLGTTTSQYINSEDRNDLLKAASFLAESIGTSLSAGGNPTLQKIAFFTQSYNAMEEQMMGPQFDGLNEWQKKLISVPYGFVIGALERYGIAALGQGGNPVINRFATAIVNRTLLSLPKNATVDTIKREINKNVGAMIAQGALRVVGGALVEGGTEATQQLFEVGEKFAVNKIIGKDKETGLDYFKDTPDITTASGLKKAFELAGTDFYYGALGGLLMAGGTNAYETIKQNSFNKRTDKEFEAFYDSMTDDKLRKLNILNTKLKLKNGEITKEEAKETIDAINSSAQKLKSLNANLSLRDKKDAFNLMLERDRLQQEKAPLDEAMQAPYNERINNINNELKIISENAVKESTKPVQEVTAEGGGIQREGTQERQPEVREGERPVGETAQPEADLGNRPVEGRGITQEEIIKEKSKLDKRVDKIKRKLKESESIEDADIKAKSDFQAISDYENNVKVYEQKTGEKLVTDEEIQKVKSQLKEQGYEESDVSIGKNIQEGKIVEIDQTEVSDKAKDLDSDFTVKEVTKVVTPEIIKDGKQIQRGKVDVIVRPKTKQELQDEINSSVDQTYKNKLQERLNQIEETEAITPTQPTAVEEAVVEQPIVEEAVVAEEVERLGKLLEGTDEQIEEEVGKLKISKDNNKVAQSIANAAKSITKILPDVKFVVHDTDASYRQATNQENRSQSSAGQYNPKTRTIHINNTKANNRTAAHEVFHAVLLEGVANDAEAQRLTKTMIDAVMKSLVNVQGSEQVISYLNDFASNYEENVRNEEKLAELFGIMSDGYQTLPVPTQSLIRRFLDRIAKMFGLKPMTDREVIQFMNSLSFDVESGTEITKNDIQAIANGSSTFISEPSVINKLTRNQEPVQIDKEFDLSFVSEKDLIDIESLIEDISNKNQKVWFWVADQLGRGMYFDSAIGRDHYLDAGPSYALDPKNRNKNVIWASGKSVNELNRFINNSDYIFIISGSPISSKFFNVRVVEILENRIPNFKKFKKDVLASNPIKGIKEIFEKHDSWESIKKSPDRKKLLNEIESVKAKKSTALKSVLEDYNAFIDANELRDGFYKENDFKMNDIMLVLKPTGVGGKSNHSTYENDILGEVVGVPNKKVNAFDIMPTEIKEKYKDITAEAQKSQVIAPYGAGVKSISAVTQEQKATRQQIDNSFEAREQKPKGITAIINAARQNGFSDAAIEQYLLGQGYSQQEITNAMTSRPASGTTIDDIFKKSQEEIEAKYKKPSIFKRFIEGVRSFRRSMIDRQTDLKRGMRGIKNKEAKQAYAKLVTKAGASGFAGVRFKIASKKIYGKLKESEVKVLDKIIYNRRMISINENRAKLREKAYDGLTEESKKDLDNIVKYKESKNTNELNKIKDRVGEKTYKDLLNRSEIYKNPYTGINGFNETDAQMSLENLRAELGEKKFNDLNKRADLYFDEFSKNLKKLKDSGRINEETYNNLKDVEYSPIKTIKYIISDNQNLADIDREAARLGITKEDIKSLTDKNENGIITDSRWLLMMNINMVENRAFENQMINEMVDAIEKATPQEKAALSDYFILDNPIVGSFKDGRAKRKYDSEAMPDGYRKVHYFKDGVDNYIIAREDIARQILDVKQTKVVPAIEQFSKDVPILGWFLKNLTLTPSRLLRFFATGGNPFFIAGNVAMDWANAVFFNDVYSHKWYEQFKLISGAKAAWGFVKNFTKTAISKGEWNKVYIEYAEHGGLMESMSQEGLRALQEMKPDTKTGRAILAPIRGAKLATWKLLMGYGKAMSYLGETSEIAMRLAVYEKMKKNLIDDYKKENNGQEPTGKALDDIMWEASREARELIDFNQGGTWAKEVDVFMPYFNASMQGFRKPLDFAEQKPVQFASGLIQLAGMAGVLAGGSIAAALAAFDDDDEEEKKKKVKFALDSISVHEKANYHIIFTGNVDKNGELEYIRIKKLPVASIISTAAENLIYQQYLGYGNEKVLGKTLRASMPIWPTEIPGRNPMIAAIVAYNNYDLFTEEQVFKAPKNKKILPIAEGIEDDRVEAIYKSLAPSLGLSPARSKAFVEKIITNESTNPTINIIYAAGNGIFDRSTPFGENFKIMAEELLKHSERKFVRKTNKDIVRYSLQDEFEKKEMERETEIYLKEQKVYNQIKKIYDEGGSLTVGELENIVEKNFDKARQLTELKKYYTYTRNMNIDKSMLDIIYEENPEVQSMRIYERYGNVIDKEEVKELGQIIGNTGKRISPKTWYYYEKEFKGKIQ